ncbi:MAG: hypothetical protein RR896_04370 [Citrobacter sp.]
MKTWFALHVPLLLLSVSMPSLAFILLPVLLAGDAFILLRAR